MEIKIGSTLFIGGESKYHLAPPVEGLEAPEIRVGDGVYAGRDGGYVSGHFYGNRTIVLHGFYIGDDCSDAASLRQALLGLLRIRYKMPILITNFNGETFFTEGYLGDIKCEVEKAVAGEFQITLICPDPFLYEARGGLPVIYAYSLALGTSTTIPNEGTVQVYPVIKFFGQMSNPKVLNETTGEVMELDIETQNDDDILTIDMENRLITLNGEGVNPTRTLESSWWELLQGANEIRVVSPSSSGINLDSYTEGTRILTGFVPSVFLDNIEDLTYPITSDTTWNVYFSYNMQSPIDRSAQITVNTNGNSRIIRTGAVNAGLVTTLQKLGCMDGAEEVQGWIDNDTYPETGHWNITWQQGVNIDNIDGAKLTEFVRQHHSSVSQSCPFVFQNNTWVFWGSGEAVYIDDLEGETGLTLSSTHGGFQENDGINMSYAQGGFSDSLTAHATYAPTREATIEFKKGYAGI